MFDIDLGTEAICEITGFKGKITARSQDLYNVDRYFIQPKIGDDNKIPAGAWVDVTNIKVLSSEHSLKKGINYKYDLGSQAKDTISGIAGTITTRQQHYNGCNYYWFSRPAKKNGDKVKGIWVLEGRIEIIKPKKKQSSAKPRTGGFHNSIK